MKLFVTIILLSFAFPFLGQKEISMAANNSKRGVIKVRKLSYDTISSVSKELDSISPGWDDSEKHIHTKMPHFKGYLNDYILLRSGNVYVFNKPISKRDQGRTFAKHESKKFWKKIRRLKKRGKIHYFKVRNGRGWVDSSYRQFFNDYRTSDIFYPESEIIAETIEEKIDSTLETKTRTDNFVRYVIFGDTFHFPVTSNGRSNVVLENLKFELTDSTNDEAFLLELNCDKTINKNTYEFQFDLRNSSSNTVKIIKNGTETFICNYRIKNRKIKIENPPIPEFAEGKVNSRLNRIRFKIHSTTHEYNAK